MITHVLLDLGNVVVGLDGQGLLSALGAEWPVEELQNQMLTYDFAADYERGRISSDAFAAAAVEALALPLTEAAFSESFAAYVAGPYPGADAWVADLRKQYRVGCLSNTNELHMGRLSRTDGLMVTFDDCFLSHETGWIKPEPEAYQHVLDTWQVTADRVLFLDDNPRNVAGARAVGMQAIQVMGLADAQARCRAVLG